MSRLDKLKEQHPELNVSLIDILTKADPTKTYKYTEFIIKIMKEWFSMDANGNEIYDKSNDILYDKSNDILLNIAIELIGGSNVDTINNFENHTKAGRIKSPDISTYNSFWDIKVAVDNANEIVRLKELEKQTKKLYNDEEWLVLIPLSYESSAAYGMNTKWCVTQRNYWDEYIRKYKLVFILNKRTNEKYAISREIGNIRNTQAWLSNDDETSPYMIPVPGNIMGIIFEEIRKDECVYDLMDKSNVSQPPIVKYSGGTSYSGSTAPNMFRDSSGHDYDIPPSPIDYVGSYIEENVIDMDDLSDTLKTYLSFPNDAGDVLTNDIHRRNIIDKILGRT